MESRVLRVIYVGCFMMAIRASVPYALFSMAGMVLEFYMTAQSHNTRL